VAQLLVKRDSLILFYVDGRVRMRHIRRPTLTLLPIIVEVYLVV